MFRTVGLSLALLLGIGSLAVVGAPIVRERLMGAQHAPPRVDAAAKRDRLEAAHAAFAEVESPVAEARPDNVALAKAAHEIAVAEQMTPLIFAPPSGVSAPLMPAADASDDAAPPATSPEIAAIEPRKNWRDARAEANVQDTEPRHHARKVASRKPRVNVAQEKPAEPVKTCVQPTGFNSFLASLNLKPHCQT